MQDTHAVFKKRWIFRVLCMCVAPSLHKSTITHSLQNIYCIFIATLTILQFYMSGMKWCTHVIKYEIVNFGVRQSCMRKCVHAATAAIVAVVAVVLHARDVVIHTCFDRNAYCMMIRRLCCNYTYSILMYCRRILYCVFVANFRLNFTADRVNEYGR